MTSTTSVPPPFVFNGRRTSGNNAPPPPLPLDMSFAFDHEEEDAEDAGSSPAPTERDHSPRPSMSSTTSSFDADDDDAMDVEFSAVHSKFSGLDLSDTDMDDSDSDSNFVTDSDTDSEPSVEDEEEDAEEDSQQPPEEDEDEEMLPNPHIPPHFTSPQYEAWLAAQVPNVVFTIRCKPLLEGSMIAAHSIRLWYRDFRGKRDAFLQAIIDEYQLLGEEDITGFVVKERRSKTWVECGIDEQTWNTVLNRIRNRFADENLTGSALAVRAELKVLVGGDQDLEGKIVEKGTYPVVEPDDDPDL
jgi:hypothetical protein